MDNMVENGGILLLKFQQTFPIRTNRNDIQIIAPIISTGIVIWENIY